MTITIDVESEFGLCMAITLFLKHCSRSILPNSVDREQLIINIESIYQDKKRRGEILRKHLETKKEDENS